ERLPSCTSVTLADVDAGALLAQLGDLALSTGAACSSDSLEPSHVLREIGLSRGEALQTVRVSFGRFSALEEVEYAAKRIADTAKRIRLGGEFARGDTQSGLDSTRGHHLRRQPVRALNPD